MTTKEEDLIAKWHMNHIAATAFSAGIPNPIWDWEKILEDWNRHGPLYNGMPEIEEEPVHITTKTVYEIEEKKIWK